MSISRREFLKSTAAATGGIAAMSVASCSLFSSRPPFDVIIKNGFVIDGSNRPGQKIDIGFRDRKILEIGNLAEFEAETVIDAANRIVAPGFIDIHTHSDTNLLINPKGESKIRQGVTTELCGNCGSSPAPIDPEKAKEQIEYYRDEYGLNMDWTDFRSFFDHINSRKIGHNLAYLIGHGTIRSYVIGEEGRKPTPDELSRMAAIAREAVEDGAIGFSTGLEYTPGSFADTDELIAIAREVQKAGGIYATHMRNEDQTVEEAVDEALRVAREAGISLQISHLKSSGKPNWGKIESLFEKIENARRDGLNVHFDRYPYIAYSTSLSALFPIWSREGGTEKFMQRLSDKDLLVKIRNEVEYKVKMIDSWNAILISGVRSNSNKIYQGKTVQQIVEESGEDPFEFVHSLMLAEKGRVSMCGFAMSEDNLKLILKHSLCMPASDGSSLADYGPLSKGSPHPRSYGTFPRFFGKFCRKEKLFSLEEAVHKATALPAQKMKLRDRGLLRSGYKGDAVVFNKDTIIDTAVFGNPHQYPKGIDYVLVNGEIAVEKGNRTEKLAGDLIKRT